MKSIQCPYCKGSGKKFIRPLHYEPCADCKGKGVLVDQSRLQGLRHRLQQLKREYNKVYSSENQDLYTSSELYANECAITDEMRAIVRQIEKFTF